MTESAHPNQEFGICAYMAYCKARGGIAVNGDALWTWNEMEANHPKVAAAWRAAGGAVAELFAGLDA